MEDALAHSQSDSQRFFGPWRLLEELGRGCFGVVFKAERVDRPGERVALKVLLEEEADPELQARFQLEIEVTRALEHPGIVRVLESGRTGGRTWYAMEYVKGPTLQQRIQEEQALPPAEAVRIVAALARAAHVAHERGVVHRDLKPANVILTGPQATPRITDFGLARAPALLRSLTRTGDIVGTPMVMAPEQLRGERGADRRVDVHALGATLYKCLTGRWPREAPTVVALLEVVKGGLVVPPSRHRAGISPDLDAACLRALERDPAGRHQTALDLAIELESAALDPPPPPRRTIGARQVAALVLVLGVGLALAFAAPRLLGSAPAAQPPPPSPPTPPPPAPAPPVERAIAAPAPDEQLRTIELGLLEVTRVMKEHEDAGALDEARRLAPRLLERHPEDLRAVLLARLASMLDARGRGGPTALSVRREAVRAAMQDPPLGDVSLGFAGRLCLELGFQRAAADLLARVERGGRIEHGWAGLSRVQVLMKADPPVRDWETAARTARASIALHERTGGPSDRFHPPTWDLHCNLGELLWALGDTDGAGDAYRAGAHAAEKREAREGLARIGEAIRSGRLPREQALLGVGTRFPLDELTFLLSAPEERLQNERRIDHAWVARELEGIAATARERGQPAHVALAELRAARAWRRAEDPDAARRALERARTGGPKGAEDLDVRLLVARELSRQLVTIDAGLAAELAREATAPWPAGEPDLRTSGELAEAWVLLGRASLELGRAADARAALAEAERLAPPDRREVDQLRAALR